MKSLITFLLFFCSTFLVAQTANDCANAIYICGDGQISTGASGVGTQELAGVACSSQENNSLWLRIDIAKDGTLGFNLVPTSSDINVDYDFFIFGPNVSCGNIGPAIRCSTTNPAAAGLSNNRTGMNASSTATTQGPGPDGTGYLKELTVNAGESYFIVIDRPIGNSPFDLEWTGTATQGTGAFPEGPIANKPNNLELCSNTGTAIFDLSPTANQITTNAAYSLSYHDSNADAVDNIDPLVNSYQNTSNPQTIHARVFNPVTNCFTITTFSLIVTDSPNISAPSPFSKCDISSDNTEFFDLSTKETEILNGLNPANYSISYYNTEPDANQKLNPIANTLNSGGQTVYTRVEGISDPDCFSVVPLLLELFALPVAQAYILEQCDIDIINSMDGITQFNLEEAKSAITANDSTTNVFFYNSITDRTNDIQITNTIGYTNTINNQTLYTKTTNPNNCENYGTLTLFVSPTLSSTTLNTSTFYTCDEDVNDSILSGTFDLEMIKTTNYPGYDVYFYASLNDASLEQNPISGNFTTEPSTLYVRLENNNTCQGVEQLDLEIHPTPKVILEDEYILCTNRPPLEINAETGFSTYTWVSVINGQENVIDNNETLYVFSPGEYKLYIGNNFNSGGTTTTCTSSKSFTVLPSNNATIKNIDINDLSNNNTVSVFVTGDGDYEYAIDNETGPYQDDHVFNHLSAGVHKVYIRDKNGCGISQKEISIIGYPKFFTPNGDGVNDTWQLVGVNELLQKQAVVMIYDRYGKLLLQLPSSPYVTWNGTFKGKQLPSSDYWFKIYVEDGRIYNGHFSLKR